jgi:hypothetical protein
MTKRRLFRIAFFNQGQLYEIYARSVTQGGLLGFVEVEGLVFGEKTRVVVDPSEERLRAEFEGVERSYLPMHSIVRIDEVEKQGPSRISEANGKGDKVAPFPLPVYSPGKKSD